MDIAFWNLVGLLLVFQPCFGRYLVDSALDPDARNRMCGSDGTPCSLPGGLRGCCSFANVTCCLDGVHCCPRGLDCVLEDGNVRCARRSSVVLPALRGVNVECLYCPETCCSLGDGTYSCCPYEDAVCCSDHVHCCPSGYTCDVSAGLCTEKSEEKLTVKTTKLQLSGVSLRDVQCPDSSSCVDGETCCLISDVSYGCCPLPDAVCCSDRAHCCPSGYTCNVLAGSCIAKPEEKLTVKSTKLRLGEVSSEVLLKIITCQDGGACEDDQTCCELSDGQYGCCPYENAVCCSDHLHCCPEGDICETSSGQCIHLPENRLALKITKLQHSEVSVKDVICPDGGTCEDDQTCCVFSNGTYGCCPYENAVCCSDHLHCCPEGYTCETSSGLCIQLSEKRLALKITKLQLSEVSVKDVICPDGGTCEDDQTCCVFSNGTYGCCPYENAVCCSDHLHCCPEGYTCETSSGLCIQLSEKRLALKITKLQLSEVSVKDVICPDGGTCEDDQTCCVFSNGTYGCCPYENAVCCSDHLHCCPEGYTCETSSGLCIQLSEKRLALKITKLQLSEVSVKDVICPDGGTCEDDQTCCVFSNGTYGCCPYENAVCCSDHLHCCPEGYTCETSSGLCIQLSEKRLALKITKLQLSEVSVKDVICPDGGTCEDDQTCCVFSNGTYGCCPYENAVCCSDHLHCCPEGYTCETSSGLCIQLSEKRLALKITKLQLSEVSVKDVICPDGGTCEDDQTCCVLSNGTYGCCPYENAVCCSDHLHCCPEGYTCETSRGLCIQLSEKRLALKITKLPVGKGRSNDVTLLPVQHVSTVTCPDHKVCPTSCTCCPTNALNNNFGCCSDGPNAVCCGDYVHCCPAGFKCDLERSVCVPPKSYAMETALTSIDVQVVCPDDGGDCPANNTCCPVKGGFGCCPAGTDAVCCQDEKHCCEEGYSCVTGGFCVRKESFAGSLLSAPQIKIKFENVDEL